MAGTTPKLALPYPTGTDRVTDGDNAIEALARKVEDSIQPAWTRITLVSGWHHYGAPNEYAQWRKVGDKVELRGVAVSDNGSGAGNWVIDLDPNSWALPPSDVHLHSLCIQSNNALTPIRLDIHRAGGNANKLTVEHNPTPISAGGLIMLNGVYWATGAQALAASKPGPDPDSGEPLPTPHDE